MMLHMLAMLVGAGACYAGHALWGAHVSLFTGFMLSSVLGGGVYIATLLGLKRLRGDF